MRRCQALDPVERFGPRRNSLTGKPGDQIDIDVLDAALPQHRDLAHYDFGGVLATGARDLPLDEALYPEAYAADPACMPRARLFGSYRPWGSFDTCLEPRPARQ